MRTTSRSRRFVPVVDCLQSRAVPSTGGAVITPMDPGLLGVYEDAPPEIVITPMDPVLLGGDVIEEGDVPAWFDSAVVAGDGLIMN